MKNAADLQADARTALLLAQAHVNDCAVMQSSAALCVADAQAAWERRDYQACLRLAVRSLAYSIGIAHEDFKVANNRVS